MQRIILASASKRRSQILSSCGIAHEVVVSNAREIMDKKIMAADMVKRNAESKAELVARSSGPAVVIGADTLVTHGNTIIGKPQDAGEAREILSRFSGGIVEVHTGLCVIDTSTGKKSSGVDTSEVRVAVLSNEEVEEFFPLLGPYDKAGGFSIEGVGSMIFDNIQGSYFNVLGLPMIKLKELFRHIGRNISDFIDKEQARLSV